MRQQIWRRMRARWTAGNACVLSLALVIPASLAEAREGGGARYAAPQPAQSTSAANGQGRVFTIEFTNARLVPSHWTLVLHPDGSGQFDATGGQGPAEENGQIFAGDVHRPVQLSALFTEKVFQTAKQKKYFAMECESHSKVAFQGAKRLSYLGPDGKGSCEFNYSKDKQIQALGDSMLGVEATLLFAARMEKLLQHDRLGLDRELESLAHAAEEGNALELGTIRETLAKVAGDEQVLDRDRKRARTLMASQ